MKKKTFYIVQPWYVNALRTSVLKLKKTIVKFYNYRGRTMKNNKFFENNFPRFFLPSHTHIHVVRKKNFVYDFRAKERTKSYIKLIGTIKKKTINKSILTF